MAQTFNGGFIVVTAVGVSAATGAASASSAIPVNGAGQVPNYIRVAARNECYVKIGTSGVTATVNDILVRRRVRSTSFRWTTRESRSERRRDADRRSS